MAIVFNNAQDHARKGIRALPKLIQFVDKHKDSIVTMNNTCDDPEIGGKHIDKTTISMLIQQINQNLDTCTREHSKAVNKAESVKTKHKVTLSGKENHLMRPFYVSDFVKEFAKNVNFGVLSPQDFEMLGKDIYMTLDPNNKSAMKSALNNIGSTKFPQDYSVYKVLEPFLERGNMINSHILSRLFYLYTISNDVVGTNGGRIKLTPEFMKYFANQKVEWIIGGNKVLKGFDTDKYADTLSRLIELGKDLEKKDDVVYKRIKKYLELEDKKSNPKHAKILEEQFKNFNLESVKDNLRDIRAKNAEVHKELNEIYQKEFGNISKNPVSVAECILAQGKTFMEVMKEFPSTDKFTSYIDEADAKDGNWGCSYRTFSTFIKYIRIPNFIVASKSSDDEVLKVLENPSAVADLKARHDLLKDAYAFKKTAKEGEKATKPKK